METNKPSSAEIIVSKFADELYHFYSSFYIEEIKEEMFCFWFEKQMIRLLTTLSQAYDKECFPLACKTFVHDKFYVFKNSPPKKTKFRKMLKSFVDGLNGG